MIAQEAFDDADDASNSFSTTLIALDGSPTSELSNLEISFDMGTTRLGDRFRTQIQLKQIPEPGTGILLSIGLVAFSVTRRRSKTA